MRFAEVRMMLRRLAPFFFAALLLTLVSATARAADEGALWTALKTPGHIAFIRHAFAPGGGDPANFTLGDCSTQRNLSDEGRRQATRTGDAFRENGIAAATVFSSQWCRCKETAGKMALGKVTELAALNSLHGRSERAPEQIKALRAHIAALDLSGPVVMVTHHATIRALAGVSTGSGEIAVVRRENDGGLTVVGEIPPRSTE